MLILTRRVGEKIFMFNENKEEIAEITLLDIKRSQIRIGINAPKNFVIHREEVVKKIAMEENLNKEATHD